MIHDGAVRFWEWHAPREITGSIFSVLVKLFLIYSLTSSIKRTEPYSNFYFVRWHCACFFFLNLSRMYTDITLPLYIYLCYYPFSNIVSHKIALITTRKPTTFAIFERTQYWTLRRTNAIYSMDCANFTLCRGIFSFLQWQSDRRERLTISQYQIWQSSCF